MLGTMSRNSGAEQEPVTDTEQATDDDSMTTAKASKAAATAATSAATAAAAAVGNPLNGKYTIVGDDDDDVNDDEDVDDDVYDVDMQTNLLKYLLESHASNMGLPGPASQLLSQLGVSLPSGPGPGRKDQKNTAPV